MYKLAYNWKRTKGSEVLEREYEYGEEFRLRREATHSLQTVQNEFKEIGYSVALTKSNKLHCFKSEMTTDGELEITEWEISIRKV